MAKLSPFHNKCSDMLDKRWKIVSERSDLSEDILPDEAGIIRDLLRAPRGVSSSFRYVLPTQLISKLAEPTLDSHSLQLRDDDGRTFNARDVAKNVVVPFNRKNDSPLGSTGDPYVNNPLRLPSLSAEYRKQQADKARWDALCGIMDTVEARNDQDFTQSLLDQVLVEIRRLIEESVVDYIIPQLVNHPILIEHLKKLLSPRTGGRRLQAVCIALFRTASSHWGIYDEVVSGAVNAPDSQGRRAADIECRKEGKTVLAVEIKDVTLTLALLEDKILSSRAAQVWELIFLIRAVPTIADAAVQERADREIAAGHSIYLLSAETFISDVLAWLGADGRRLFVRIVGQVLDEFVSDYSDRRAWADILLHWTG